MKEQIKLLIQLQEIDKQIFDLKAEKETKPAQIEALKADYENEEAKLKELQERSKSLQVKRKEQEVDLESKETNIKKYQTQLYQVKTNKEYTSLLHEIEGLRADCSILEDKILTIMEDLEKLDAQIKAEKEKLKNAEVDLKQKEEIIRQEIKHIEQKISSLMEERQKIASLIKPDLLSRYENIQQKKNDGLALVPVVNSTCQGCHINLPPQTVNEIMMENKLHSCESCARLLYYGQ